MIRPNLWASPRPGKGKYFLTFSRVRNHARGPSNSEQMKGDLCKIVICQHLHSFCHVLLSNSEEGTFSTLQILSPPGLLVLGFGEQLVILKEQEVGGAGCLSAPTHQEAGEGPPALGIGLSCLSAFPGGAVVKTCLPMQEMQETQETWLQSLGREDPLEEERQPALVFLPGESHGQRSLAGYSPWPPRVRHD